MTNCKERYLDITGFENHYKISNLGNVKSLKRGKQKILNGSPDSNGYLRVNLCKESKRYHFYIHKLVAITFLNHIPDGYAYIIDHIDNDKSNNNVDNLQITTQRENASKNIPKNRKSSKHVGVSWDKKEKIWHSRIYINGKINFLGRFKNELDAAKAYHDKLILITN